VETPLPNPLLPTEVTSQVDPLAPPPEHSYHSFMGRMIPTSNLAALSAYYMAMFSLIPVVGIFLGPPALILGLIGFSRALGQPQRRGLGHAIFSIATGILVTILNWGFGIVVLTAWYFVPQLFQTRPPME
jgi:hypothetical protein